MSKTTHLVLISVVAAVIGTCFLQEPVLGDDLTYWALAFDVHERGFAALRDGSFYDLRWPVWAVCWLLQCIARRGLLSYWGVPVLYLAAGAALTFAFAKRLTASVAAAWVCGLGFVLHPFVDPVAYSPMPDLSEGVWGVAAMLGWWNSMHARDAARSWVWATLTGFCIFVLEANRVTGVFLVPVLVLGTVLFFRQRFRWLIAAGLVTLALYAAESSFYQHLFGDWLHDLSANAHNKGAQGTDFPHPWMLPFRFLDTFWHEPLARFYSLAALAGIWFGFRKGDLLWRVVIAWASVLLLEYSCAVQSLSPVRPLVRDGTRFLSCLAAPISMLAVLGLRELLALSGKLIARGSVIPGPIQARLPLAVGLLAVAFLTAATRREFFNPGFVPQFRSYLALVPDGTSIFSHTTMRDIVNLVDRRGAERLRWVTHAEILRRDPTLETEAAGCDEFWYERTLALLWARQDLHRLGAGSQPALASYFFAPEREWMLTGSLMKAGSPELVFYRRRPRSDQPQIFGNEAVEWRDLIPRLPALWQHGRSPAKVKAIWTIPDSFKGRLVRFQLDGASDDVDAFSVRLRFIDATRKQEKPFVLRPSLYPGGGTDFFTLQIPATSTACEIQLRFAEQTERVVFTHFKAVVENPPAPP